MSPLKFSRKTWNNISIGGGNRAPGPPFGYALAMYLLYPLLRGPVGCITSKWVASYTAISWGCWVHLSEHIAKTCVPGDGDSDRWLYTCVPGLETGDSMSQQYLSLEFWKGVWLMKENLDKPIRGPRAKANQNVRGQGESPRH